MHAAVFQEVAVGDALTERHGPHADAAVAGRDPGADAPHVAARTQEIIITAINARNDNVYFQVFAPNGTTVVTPRLDHASNAVLAAVAEPTLITGSGAMLLAAHWPSALPMPRLDIRAAPDIGWVARLGAAAGAENASPKPLYLRRPDARPQDGGRLPRR